MTQQKVYKVRIREVITKDVLIVVNDESEIQKKANAGDYTNYEEINVELINVDDSEEMYK